MSMRRSLASASPRLARVTWPVRTTSAAVPSAIAAIRAAPITSRVWSDVSISGHTLPPRGRRRNPARQA